MPLRGRCGAGLAVALLVWPAALVAQPRPRGGCRDAGRRLETALELRERALEVAALEVLTDLYAECPSPRVQAQMGLAAQGLRRWVDARTHLRGALGAVDDAWVRRVRSQLEAALGLVEAELGWAAPTSDTPGTELFLDGRAVGTLPLAEALPVVPGRHTAEFRAPGHLPVSRAFEVTAQARWTPSIELPPEAPTAPVAAPVVVAPPAAPRVRWWTERRVLGVSLAGAGLVLGVVALAQWRAAVEQADASRYAYPARSDAFGAWWRFQATVNPTNAQGVGAVCDLAETSDHPDAAQVRGLCDDNASLRVQQWVFGLAGLGLMSAGAVLTFTRWGAAAGAHAAVPRVEGGWLPGARAGQLTARWTF